MGYQPMDGGDAYRARDHVGKTTTQYSAHPDPVAKAHPTQSRDDLFAE